MDHFVGCQNVAEQRLAPLSGPNLGQTDICLALAPNSQDKFQNGLDARIQNTGDRPNLPLISSQVQVVMIHESVRRESRILDGSCTSFRAAALTAVVGLARP